MSFYDQANSFVEDYPDFIAIQKQDGTRAMLAVLLGFIWDSVGIQLGGCCVFDISNYKFKLLRQTVVDSRADNPVCYK